jgi:FRG domain
MAHSFTTLTARASVLNRLSIRGASIAIAAPDIPVIRIQDPNALTQVMGWLKFTAGSGRVLFRGQGTLYPSLRPSAMRELKPGSMTKYSKAMKDYIEACTGASCRCAPGGHTFGHGERCIEQVNQSDSPRGIVAGTYRAAVEPMLQHYGLRTRWLDLVDNIWVALWFGCQMHIQHGRHASHLTRSDGHETDGRAYVLVLDLGRQEETAVPGYSLGDVARIVDLRYSVPSLYLRPHAQHGLLAAPRRMTPSDPDAGDMSTLVIAVLEIELSDALVWLGSGSMLSTHVLFPPATHDAGYRRLLDYAPPPPPTLGSFLIYGPSGQ